MPLLNVSVRKAPVHGPSARLCKARKWSTSSTRVNQVHAQQGKSAGIIRGTSKTAWGGLTTGNSDQGLTKLPCPSEFEKCGSTVWTKTKITGIASPSRQGCDAYVAKSSEAAQPNQNPQLTTKEEQDVRCCVYPVSPFCSTSLPPQAPLSSAEEIARVSTLNFAANQGLFSSSNESMGCVMQGEASLPTRPGFRLPKGRIQPASKSIPLGSFFERSSASTETFIRSEGCVDSVGTDTGAEGKKCCENIPQDERCSGTAMRPLFSWSCSPQTCARRSSNQKLKGISTVEPATCTALPLLLSNAQEVPGLTSEQASLSTSREISGRIKSPQEAQYKPVLSERSKSHGDGHTKHNSNSNVHLRSKSQGGESKGCLPTRPWKCDVHVQQEQQKVKAEKRIVEWKRRQGELKRARDQGEVEHKSRYTVVYIEATRKVAAERAAQEIVRRQAKQLAATKEEVQRSDAILRREKDASDKSRRRAQIYAINATMRKNFEVRFNEYCRMREEQCGVAALQSGTGQQVKKDDACDSSIGAVRQAL
ncbi:unnamed protein product [Choristocarpus tenellus]